jgi:hypothetical protein
MSGNRAITLTLSVRDADSVKRSLEGIGPAGEQALQRLEAAAQRAQGRAGAGGGGGGMAGLGQTIGQAGFQLQDFAVQVQGGTSALTALSQQGSQFLGIFGAGGAIAGAVLAAGLLATQFLTGGDAAKALNDALKAQADLYERLNDAAQRRGEGQADELQRVLRLRDYYASLTEEQRRGVEVQQRLADTAAQVQATRTLDGATSRVRGLLSVGQNDEFGLARTPEGLRAVEAAYQGIDVASGNASAQLQRYIGALDEAIARNPRHASTLTEARDAAAALADVMARVDAAARAAGRGIDEAGLAALRLAQQNAASSVGVGLNAQLMQAQQVAQRYARGDVAGARALTRQAEIDQRAETLAEQARQEARRAFPEGTDRTTIDAAVNARRDEIDRTARSLAETERRNRDAEAAAREAEANARRGGRAGEAAARREAREAARLAERDLASEERGNAAAVRELEQALRAVETPLERHFRQIVELGELQDRLAEAGQPLATEDYDRLVRGYDQQLEQAEAAANRTNSAARELGMTFSSAFEDAIVKGKDLQEVLQGVAEDLARIILRQAVVNPLANAASGAVGQAGNFLGSLFSGTGGAAAPVVASALGNAFFGGRLTAFAAGGVVDRATVVPMALMGEAGPEAVVPLKRGRDGKLGIAGQGGGGGMVYSPTINIDARGADPSVVPMIRQAVEIAVARSKAETFAEIQRGGRAAKVVGRRG